MTNPTDRLLTAKGVSDYLISLATTKSVVTFLDGFVSPVPGEYNTHTVVVEFPRFGGFRKRKVQGQLQGSVELALRDVTP